MMRDATGRRWIAALVPALCLMLTACSGENTSTGGTGKPLPTPVIARDVEVTEATAEFPNGAIWYREAGRGPTVLFLHGWGGNADQWRYQIQPLATRGWRVVVPDLPETRNSQFTIPGFDGKDVSIQEDLVLRFLDRLAVREVHLVAHSWGGLIAQRIVIDHSERVSSLVLVDTAVDPTQVDALAKIECPTLIVWAENDPISPIGIGRSLAKLIPGAEIFVMENVAAGVDKRKDPAAAHVPPLYEPEVFNRRLIEFLSPKR